MFPFHFAYPARLLLLLLLGPVIYLARTTRAPLIRWREAASLAMRILMVLFLVLALSGLRIVRTKDELTVLFLLDNSASVSEAAKEEALALINEAASETSAKEKAGLIVFGAEAAVEMPPQYRLSQSDIESEINREFTNIEMAIRLALATFSEDTQKRIVLFSDGNENLGDAREAAKLAESAGVDIHTFLLPTSTEDEVLVDFVRSPEVAKEDEPFSLEVGLRSFRSGPAVLRLYRNRQYMGAKEINLKEGLNRFEVRERLQRSGFYEYEVLVEALGDGSFSNNRGYAFTQVMGEPRILLLEGKPEEAESLSRALERGGFNLHLQGPAGLPASMAEFQNYDAILLSDISALCMTDAQMEMLKVFVRDLGGGLAMIGGEESFGLGGYYRTPVEEALPVEMDVRRKKKLPSLALVLCIDKSGSMADSAPGAQKVSLAKEAAILTLELLADWDEIGVIAFDGAPKWAARLQKAKNRAAIVYDIRAIRAGGGTAIYPALVEAADALKGTKAILKHTIVMTDGMSRPGDFEGIVAQMNKEAITISAVGIGPDADKNFLENLAAMGGGRFYWGRDTSFIPRIFTKDALIASRALLVEEEFRPRILRWAEILKGIDWDGAPVLLGYVDTTAKNRAEVIMSTQTGDPLLARFRFGLGKSLAFTSDAKGRWAKHWLQWPGYEPFWTQTLRWLLRARTPGNLSTTLLLDSGKGKVVVDAVTPEGEFQNFLDLSVRVVKPDFSTETFPLTQVAPGRYEAEFAALSSGTYMANIAGPEAGLLDSAGATLGYPPEYKDVEPSPYLLERLASISGGQVTFDLTRIFEHKKERPHAYLEIWMPLLIAALVLLFLDIVTRRFVMPETLLKLREKRVRRVIIPTDRVMARLKRRKEALGLKAQEATEIEAREILEKIPKPEPQAPASPAGGPEKREEPLEEEPSAADTYTERLLEAKRKARKERRF